jgi:hypothetical protein
MGLLGSTPVPVPQSLLEVQALAQASPAPKRDIAAAANAPTTSFFVHIIGVLLLESS